MRVAICISGQLRTFESTFESLSKHILRPFNCDVFLSTWNDVGILTSPSKAPHEVLDNAARLYSPVKMDVESWPQVRSGWGDLTFFEKRTRLGANPQNLLAMYYK